MKKIYLFIFITFLLFTAACSSSLEVNESYPSESVDSIKVYNDSWDVRFKKSDSNEVIFSAEGKQNEENSSVTFQVDGTTLIIKQEDQTESGFFKGFTFGKKGTISIHIPESVINDIELINKDGNIEIAEISIPNIIVQNNSGDGKIEGVIADAGEIVTNSGMLSIVDSSFEDLSITSIGGEVAIKEIEEGNLAVNTDSGDISISYKSNPTSLNVMAQSNSSNVTLNLDGLQKEEDTENVKRGTIGDGQNNLDLTSNKGVIHISN